MQGSAIFHIANQDQQRLAKDENSYRLCNNCVKKTGKQLEDIRENHRWSQNSKDDMQKWT